jgi:transcriptional regulator with XRE-family HTH domain
MVPERTTAMSYYECPVCGFDELTKPPSDYYICPCCGVEFENDTFDREYPELRSDWITRGMPWFSRSKAKPREWNPFRQLIIAGFADDLLDHSRMKDDVDFRYAVDEAFSDVRIAKQLKFTRESRKEPQSGLATKAEMKQSRISELESMDYSAWSISTLRRLARALGVRLSFAFEAWHELRPELDDLTPERLAKPAFDEDMAFHELVGALTLTDSVGAGALKTIEDGYHLLTTEIRIRKPTVKARPRSTAEDLFDIAA